MAEESKEDNLFLLSLQNNGYRFKTEENQGKYDEYMDTYFGESKYPPTQQMIDIIKNNGDIRTGLQNLMEDIQNQILNFEVKNPNHIDLKDITPEITFDQIMELVTMISIKEGNNYSDENLKEKVSIDILRYLPNISINMEKINPFKYFPDLTRDIIDKENSESRLLSDMIFIILMIKFDENKIEIDYNMCGHRQMTKMMLINI